MKHLIEISGNDIASLNDAELRELTGLLCEAELKKHNLSPHGATWGGHQNAKDGGLDVVVETDRKPEGNFIPRQKTGFQVKKSDMPPSGITAEMRPNGELKNSIKSLIENKGSYVVISSKSSTSHSALKNRQQAMIDAVADIPGHENIYLDFYDQNRIATWVRTFPSLVLWVRNKIGRHLQGWKSLENWSFSKEEIDEYIFDKDVRLFDGTTKNAGQELSIEYGINKFRTLLSTTKTCIRLAGLSGVGKTRFAQALFDERIGSNCLNPSQVLYTDISDSPEPDPRSLAEQLIALESSGIIIVDNCPPELHRKLTQVCSSAKSKLSLLTIEYDVRDDLPEETKVFRMEPASNEVVIKLIRRRFTHISELDAKTIADFSGGNARLAIVLASTVEVGSTLSGFQDEELFKRLFHQRNAPDQQLMLSAQVLSLVYSFNGEDTGIYSELEIIGSLVGKSALELYRDVSHLKERHLIQSRGKWRALLPHAVANRLAKYALDIIPPDKIVSTFRNISSERLIKSFAHRLYFLHDSPVAIKITNDWLSKDGWLGKMHTYNEFQMTLFEYIAPISPVKALDTIEYASKVDAEFTTRSNVHHYKIAQLLRSLAYDENLFVRCAKLLIQFAINEKTDEKNNSSREVLKSLFPLYLSGTHAPAEVRYSIIETLLLSENKANRILGGFLLDAALEAANFSSIYNSNFGARPRNYGYQPQNLIERNGWYKYFIDKCVSLILLNNDYSTDVKSVLAKNFRGLWKRRCLYEELEKASQHIITKTPWNEGWVQVRLVIRYDGNDFTDDNLQRLVLIENLLKPNNLIENVRIYALKGDAHSWDLDLVEYDSGNKTVTSVKNDRSRIDEIRIELGVQLSKEPTTLHALVKELVTSDGHGTHQLGEGIALGAENKLHTWNKLREQIDLIEFESIRIGVLVGYIYQLSKTDSLITNQILDVIINDPILGRWLPRFQCAAGFDKKGVVRINKVLDDGISLISAFYCIAYGRFHENISDNDLAHLLSKFLKRDEGDDVVLEILNMRFDGNTIPEKYNTSLIKISRELLKKYNFSLNKRDKNIRFYHLHQVARVALHGDSAKACAIQLSKRLLKAIENHEVFSFDCSELFNILAEQQALIFLDVFINRKPKKYQRENLFHDTLERHENPIDKISDQVIIGWCETDPAKRYPLIASNIEPFQLKEEKENKVLVWKPIIYTILENAPDKISVLNKFEASVYPSSWTNSLAAALEFRFNPLKELLNYKDLDIHNWAEIACARLQTSIDRYRQSEKDEMRRVNESFE